VKTVLRLGGLDKTRVFLGYSSQANTTASRIKEFMRSELGLHVTDWATDFQTGEVILSEIQAAAHK